MKERFIDDLECDLLIVKCIYDFFTGQKQKNFYIKGENEYYSFVLYNNLKTKTIHWNLSNNQEPESFYMNVARFDDYSLFESIVNVKEKINNSIELFFMESVANGD